MRWPQLNPLRDAMLRGPWPNRDLLMVPLGSGIALAAQASQLAGTGWRGGARDAACRQAQACVDLHRRRLEPPQRGRQAYRALPTEMTRAVPRPAIPPTEAATQPMDLQPLSVEAATALLSTPDRRRPGQAMAPRRCRPRLRHVQAMPAATSCPMPMRSAPMPMPVPGGTRWQAYADRCALIKGTMSCCVFDMHSSQSLASAGGPPAATWLLQGVLLATMGDARRWALGQAKAEVPSAPDGPPPAEPGHPRGDRLSSWPAPAT
jgi:hypothetical protein